MRIMSKVSIVKTDCYDEAIIAADVRKAVELIGGMASVVKPGDKVLVKPNFAAVPLDRLSGAITRWEVCKAVMDLVREVGGEPFIAESSAAGVDTEKVIEACGYDQLREQGYEVIDLKRAEKTVIPVKNGLLLKELNTWKPVVEADVIISVPVMKTHDQTEVTLGMKNIKGLIGDTQKKWFHTAGVQEGVVDLNATLKPKLTVMDGTIAQEGYGPLFGDRVEMGVILASTDVVACDAVGGKLMGYEPEEVGITRIAGKIAKIGELDISKIEIAGNTIEETARVFKRSSQVEIPGLPDFKLILTEGACTGCRNTVISAIMDMKNDGIEHTLAGKTILVGPFDQFPEDVDPKDIVLIGKCTMKFRDRATFVPGCPPNNIFVERGISGIEDVKRRYSTEGDVD
ncbi:MAG: HAD-superfamily hydrolase [Oscillospiraceae bacterium]|nr:HAD-superfamily hydrolase [Oscillospiraceae bacterium]